jgi:class 3 adenylate cyclase
MASSDSRPARFGLLANTCALASLLMCFGQAGIASLLAYVGVSAAVGDGSVPDVQAVLMWGLAAVVVVGLNRDRRQHAQSLPMVLAAVGLGVMVLTLYVYYHWMILTFAYICLIAAVLINQTMGIRSLYRKIKQQAVQLEQWNRSLQQTVADEIGKNERLERLKRFLSPQVVDLVTSAGGENVLSSHRRRIAVVFCDLRGFTEFSDSTEPEESMELLQRYHEELGKLVLQFNGTIDHRAGDGLMVIFNDPMPVEAPVMCSVEMAIAMRERVDELLESWKRRRNGLGFGVGIAYGYATLGMVGFEGRFDYTANGNTVNLAARLCDEAKDGQIIVSHDAYAEVEESVRAERMPPRRLKGFRDPVYTFNVMEVRSDPVAVRGPRAS